MSDRPRDVGFDLAAAIRTLNDALAAGEMSINEYIEVISSLGDKFTAAQAIISGFSGVITNFQTAFRAAADLVAGNVDELVGLYGAQINVIQTQNRLTQAYALNSIAAQVYGATSEQAQRTTVAANYTSALYVQAKKNEQVAQMEYTTATAKNVATMATSFTQLLQSAVLLIVGINALAASAETSAARAALAAIPVVGLALVAGATAYQMATTPALPTVPSRQFGGGIPKTGLYMMHEGESVTPKGGATGMGTGSPNVTININATGGVDLARVRQEVEAALAKNLLVANRQRGVY